MPLLSVIIPFGLSKERPYIEERVLQKAKFFQSDAVSAISITAIAPLSVVTPAVSSLAPRELPAEVFIVAN